MRKWLLVGSAIVIVTVIVAVQTWSEVPKNGASARAPAISMMMTDAPSRNAVGKTSHGADERAVTAAGASAAVAAAWTAVSRVLLNLDETITRE